MNIKEIARLCEVSPSTVSKILNKKDDHISDATKQRVLAIINEYQYVPYSKVLRNGIKKTGLIGVVVQSFGERENRLLTLLEKRLAEKGYHIIPITKKSGESRKPAAILENKGVEGIILLFVDEQKLSTGLPQVSVGSSSRQTVHYNIEEAARLATDYLLARGHQKIGCIYAQGQDKVASGYSKSFHHRNIAFSKTVFCPYQKVSQISEFAFWQGEEDFTGIVCDTIESACFLYQTLQSQGVSVPNDLSIICLEEAPLADILKPTLTTINFPCDKIVSQIIDRILQQVENKKGTVNHSDKLTFKVIERESVTQCLLDYQRKKILIVGSINMDFVIFLNRLPSEGETVVSENIYMLPGGKGANQAVGVAKLGAPAYILGCVGKDREGREIYNKLISDGVKAEAIMFRSSVPTGKAYINVARNGESTITVYSGANAKLSQSRISKYNYLFHEAEYCLLSLEIPEEAVRRTLQLCHENNVKVILKPAPANKMRSDFYPLVDYFVPNEKEMNQLFPDQDMGLADKAEILLGYGVRNVVVTLGSHGCYVRNHQYNSYFPAANFQAIDTTGAADAFISALAVYLREGIELPMAIGYATYAGGISITRTGVQAAMTNRVGLEIYQDKIIQQFGIKH